MFVKSRSSWYCLIKYPAFASVKTVTLPPKSFVQYFFSVFSFPVFGVQFFVRQYHQRQAYGINIHSIHSCKHCTHTRMCKVQFCATQCPWYYHTLYTGIYFFHVDFHVFLWHSIHNCTYARFVTRARGTLKLAWTNQPTLMIRINFLYWYLCTIQIYKLGL